MFLWFGGFARWAVLPVADFLVLRIGLLLLTWGSGLVLFVIGFIVIVHCIVYLILFGVFVMDC